jgi:transposase
MQEWRFDDLERANCEVERLEREIERRDRRIRELERERDRLKEEIGRVERESHRQAAPFARPERVPPASCGRPGRRRGHPAAYRPRPARIDERVEVLLTRCPACRGRLCGRRRHRHVEVEIPPIRPVAREYVTESGYCRRCRRRFRSRHPEQVSEATGAAGVAIGARAQALAVEMKHGLGVPYRKTAAFFRRVFDLPVTHGALVQGAARLAERAEPTYEALCRHLACAPRCGTDETGWRIGGDGAWLWAFTTPEATLYKIARSRGVDVVEEVLGAGYGGVLQCDGFPAYRSWNGPKAQCAAHILRRAGRLHDLAERGSARLPLAVRRLWEAACALAARRRRMRAAVFKRKRTLLERRLDRLLAGRYTDAENARFVRHLARHRGDLLRFLYDPGIEPTNNRTEREIRPAVLARKISAGNRSDSGARAHEILASVHRTAARNGLTMEAIVPALLRAPVPQPIRLIAPHS